MKAANRKALRDIRKVHKQQLRLVKKILSETEDELNVAPTSSAWEKYREEAIMLEDLTGCIEEAIESLRDKNI